MRKLFNLSIFSVLLITSNANGTAEPIVVLVHNFAGVEADVLKDAEKTAARVLATGGVQVEWLECADGRHEPEQCQNDSDASFLTLHLLPAGVTRRSAPSGALGFAVPASAEQSGPLAGVFCDRVKRLSSGHFREPVILGHAIAHELGHILLGVGMHSDDGIMKAEWHRKELERAETGTLVFDAMQRTRIRQNLSARFSARTPHRVQAVVAHLRTSPMISILK